MTQIVPAGGKKMEWVKDPEQLVTKVAQGMFEDDPQLDAIKGLPGMQDGIDELNEMANSECGECTASPELENFGGSIEQAIEKVKDAALGVADAAKKEIKQNVTDALSGKDVAMVSEKIEEENPEGKEVEEFEFEIPVSDESGETTADEAHEEHEKSETEEEEKKEEEIPGVEGDKEEGIEKEGDKEAFASGKGMRRLAELSADETKELSHYWKDLLGFPAEYVNAMLKSYRA
jgi:hypothetical protein